MKTQLKIISIIVVGLMISGTVLVGVGTKNHLFITTNQNEADITCDTPPISNLYNLPVTNPIVPSLVNTNQIFIEKLAYDGGTWQNQIFASPGETIQFKIKVSYNQSYCGHMVTNIEVADVLPNSLIYDETSVTIEYGDESEDVFEDYDLYKLIEHASTSYYTDHYIVWNLTDLYGIELFQDWDPYHSWMVSSVTIYYNATISPLATPSTCYNAVNIQGIEHCCGEPVNGEDTLKIVITDQSVQHELSVEKYVKWDCTPPFKKNVTASVGEWVTFKLYVNNTGDVPLDITVKDELPSGLTYVTGSTDITGISVSPEEPTISGNTLSWYLDDVPDSTSVVITFRADVDECGEHVNLVNVTGECECQGQDIYDEDTAIVWVPCPPGEEGLTVEKYVKWDCTPPFKKNVTASVGEWVTFKLYVNNTGDVPLDITVKDELPSGLTYVTGSSVMDAQNGVF